MKKSLIALAALAFVGVASAQSSVTLYGIADIWVGKPEGGKVQAGSGGVNQSRFGLKGSEDLGGGLKAVFTLESGFSLANGAVAGTLFNRQANVGLEGGFGTIKLGQNWNALDDMFGAANSGFDSALSATGVWKNSYTGAAAAQVYYATPDFAGFSGAFSTQLKGNVPAGLGKVTAFHLKYSGGPVYAGIGYEDDATIGGQKGTMINGSYDLGVAKLLGSYYKTTKTAGLGTVNSYQLGADIPMGSALTLSVGYAASKEKGGQNATGIGLAAAYSLSKRTMLYGGFRATNNVAGNDLWAVGVNHKF